LGERDGILFRDALTRNIDLYLEYPTVHAIGSPGKRGGDAWPCSMLHWLSFRQRTRIRSRSWRSTDWMISQIIGLT